MGPGSIFSRGVARRVCCAWGLNVFGQSMRCLYFSGISFAFCRFWIVRVPSHPVNRRATGCVYLLPAGAAGAGNAIRTDIAFLYPVPDPDANPDPETTQGRFQGDSHGEKPRCRNAETASGPGKKRGFLISDPKPDKRGIKGFQIQLCRILGRWSGTMTFAQFKAISKNAKCLKISQNSWLEKIWVVQVIL